MNPNAPAAGEADSAAWRMLAWAGVALQGVGLLFVLWSQQWNGAWTIALFLGLSTGFLLMQDRLPGLIDFLVVLAALLNAGGWAWEWYQTFAWFDEFVHGFTSFAVVAAIAWIAWSRRWITAASGSKAFILQAAAIGFGLGVVWEIVESLFLNLTFWDTIVDLIMDTLGAAVAGWFLGQITPNARPSSGTQR